MHIYHQEFEIFLKKIHLASLQNLRTYVVVTCSVLYRKAEKKIDVVGASLRVPPVVEELCSSLLRVQH